MFVETQCLAEETGGLFSTVETERELVKALDKTLGCPMMTEVAPARFSKN